MSVFGGLGLFVTLWAVNWVDVSDGQLLWTR